MAEITELQALVLEQYRNVLQPYELAENVLAAGNDPVLSALLFLVSEKSGCTKLSQAAERLKSLCELIEEVAATFLAEQAMRLANQPRYRSKSKRA